MVDVRAYRTAHNAFDFISGGGWTGLHPLIRKFSLVPTPLAYQSVKASLEPAVCAAASVAHP